MQLGLNVYTVTKRYTPAIVPDCVLCSIYINLDSHLVICMKHDWFWLSKLNNIYFPYTSCIMAVILQKIYGFKLTTVNRTSQFQNIQKNAFIGCNYTCSFFCDFLSRYLQLKHYRYILLQSDSEQRLIGTKWKQQDGGCEEVIKASAPGGVCSTVDW